jgi:hypothetical protein
MPQVLANAVEFANHPGGRPAEVHDHPTITVLELALQVGHGDPKLPHADPAQGLAGGSRASVRETRDLARDRAPTTRRRYDRRFP